MLAGVNPAVDRPVILFKDIVEVLHRSMSAVPLQSSLGLELHDGWRITGVLVGVDYPRRRMVRSAQRFGEKALGRRCIAFGREPKSIVAPVESTARYKYTHLPLTRM